MRTLLRAASLVALGLLLLACGAEEGRTQRPDADVPPGLQLTGTVSGRQLAVSDGAPVLRDGDCHLRHEVPSRLCFVSRNIEGTPVLLALANPAAHTMGEPLDVVASTCRSAADCTEVVEGAVVDLTVGDQRLRARGGSVTLRVAEAGERYVGSVNLRMAEGRVTGTFDVVPRPD